MSYKVSGRGNFPIDMLRYDGVYPASEKDSGIIQSMQNDGGRRTGEVEGRGCTPAHWESFMWRVDSPYPKGFKAFPKY